MSVRSVFSVLAAFGLALAVSSSALAGDTGTEFGQPGDGFIDLYIDLWPGGQFDPPDPRPPEDTGVPGAWIDPDGTDVNGFVLQSAACIFDGPEDPILTGLFQGDGDCLISDGFIIPPLPDARYMADIFRTSILPALGGPEAWTPDQFLDDLTVTYTIQGQPGTFFGDIIVSEPQIQECEPPVLGALPLQLVEPGQLAEFLVTATDPDLPNDTLTFSFDPTLPELVNPWPTGATIDGTTGQLSWQVPPGLAMGRLFDAGVVVTDSCETPGPLSDAGVLTFQVVPEPGTIAMLVSGTLLGLALLRRRRAA